MELNIKVGKTKHGITAKMGSKKFRIIYPNGLWQAYPTDAKAAFIDNISYLLTISSPLISGAKKITYNTATPVFKSYFEEVVKKSIPHGVEDYKQSAKEVMKQFLATKYEFVEGPVKKFPFKIKAKASKKFDERSINLLSFGKDSLTSFAVCHEIGLNPVAVYVNETVSPPEHRYKLSTIPRFSKEIGIEHFVIKNEFEQINDFETWDKDETCVGYSHMITAFTFLTLPIVNKVGAKYIVLGNEQDMEFRFKSKSGTMEHPSYDQTAEWTLKQKEMIKQATGGNATVMSVIEPITNIATVKILHQRYPKFAKYQTSCSCLDGTRQKRWCQDCSDCVGNVLFMKAFNYDIKTVGLRNLLLNRKCKEYIALFDGKEIDCWSKSKEARDQELLAFLLAYKNGHRGQLIEMFKKKFLEEAEEREEELRKKFFRIYKSKTMPRKIERAVTSIYKEELSDLA